MNKILLIAFVAFMTVVEAQGQLTLGLGGNLQNTSMSGDDPSYGFLRGGIGFGVSGFASYDLTSDIALFIQPGYDMRTTHLSYIKAVVIEGEKVDSTIDSATVKTSYLTIPIGVRIFSANRNWFFSTGASLNLLQSAEQYSQDSLVQSDVPALSSMDLLMFAGIGYVLPLGPIDLTFEARYQVGLIDIVDEVNSSFFVASPVVRQSGLMFNVAMEVPIGDVPSASQDSSLESNDGPRMGEHLFSLPTNMLAPFIRTVTSFNIGGGQSMNIDFPIIKINDELTIAPSGNILVLSVVARHEQKIREWMSFHAYLISIARVGTNVSALLSQGVNSVIGFGMGWNVRIIETEKIAIAGGLDLRQSEVTNINLQRWIDGVIDSGKVTADNPLIDSKPTLRTVASLRGAYTFSRTFGLLGFFEGGYGESSSRGAASSVAMSTGAFLSIDLNPATDVPIGITAGGGYRQSPEAADGTSEESRILVLRFGQTSMENFALGAQMTWLFTSLEDIDPSLSVIAFTLDMKFYY